MYNVQATSVAQFQNEAILPDRYLYGMFGDFHHNIFCISVLLYDIGVFLRGNLDAENLLNESNMKR